MSQAGKPFSDQLVVVTGAGNGIGRATALGFAANGARLVAADLDLAAAASVCELIVARGGQAHARQVDVARADDMERFAGWVRSEIGIPDIAVNNAGIAIAGPFLAHTEEEEADRALRRRNFPPEKVALPVMRAVLHGKTVVPVNAEARIGYALSLLAPSALRALARREASRSLLGPSRVASQPGRSAARPGR